MNFKKVHPEGIAGAILRLASDDLAGHVSGQTITIAGGMEGRVFFAADETDSGERYSSTDLRKVSVFFRSSFLPTGKGIEPSFRAGK